MHIPDGYLSPSTCAVLYAAAAPFWYVALRRMRRLVRTRLVPLVALFAAFSFVVMMFNLPLPGGTTGHAVGMGVATIVLGPWASMLAISAALLVQALFFGDGGVTAYGANCFNMAVVGSLAAWAAYKVLAGRSAVDAPRRVFAATAAGYLAINAAALVASIEFGIQPALFHDASGAPLYCPYGLSVAMPAMMIGHLTFAGFAEAILTGGVVAYLQRSDPALLAATAAGAAPSDASGSRPTARPLWLAVGVLMLATPLGLLAAGTAWGEWGPEDFADPNARVEIAASSGDAAAPSRAPEGLERLSAMWTAPMPDYAPPLLRSRALGYVLSAMAGGGIVILSVLGVSRILRAWRPDDGTEG